jgi:hypothetical protein
MSNSPLELPGSERASLRAAVETVNRQVSSLKGHATLEEFRAATDTLVGSFTELVKLLDLGEAPALRECPRCKHLGMRAASRCGYCWIDLAPLADEAAAVAAPLPS